MLTMGWNGLVARCIMLLDHTRLKSGWWVGGDAYCRTRHVRVSWYHVDSDTFIGWTSTQARAKQVRGACRGVAAPVSSLGAPAYPALGGGKPAAGCVRWWRMGGWGGSAVHM